MFLQLQLYLYLQIIIINPITIYPVLSGVYAK
jgi:hypothetical protein